VRSGEVVRFARELADAVNSGLSLTFSLSILHDKQKPGALKNILGQLAEDIRSGMSFSEALAKYPKISDDLCVEMIRGGEEHGNLPIVLDMWAVLAEKREALTEKIRKTRRHQVIITLAAAMFAFFLLAIAVPRFARIYSDVGFALPIHLNFLLRISETYGSLYPAILGYIAGVVIGIALLFRIEFIRTIWHVITFKIPIIGRTGRVVGIAQFTRALGMLILSGVPSSRAYCMAGRAIDNRAIARVVNRIHESVQEGERISYLLQRSGVFPPPTVDMLAVGESFGNLSPTLLAIADEYDKIAFFILGRRIRMFTYIVLAVFLLIFLFVVSVITPFPIMFHPGMLI
jgi:type IV pilus assembly protein PilC